MVVVTFEPVDIHKRQGQAGMALVAVIDQAFEGFIKAVTVGQAGEFVGGGHLREQLIFKKITTCVTVKGKTVEGARHQYQQHIHTGINQQKLRITVMVELHCRAQGKGQTEDGLLPPEQAGEKIHRHQVHDGPKRVRRQQAITLVCVQYP